MQGDSPRSKERSHTWVFWENAKCWNKIWKQEKKKKTWALSSWIVFSGSPCLGSCSFKIFLSQYVSKTTAYISTTIPL